ncbi:4-hydroxythreonine-4-phosphate dehydrogenase PdxA [candidate division KSB1 bacterium]|nr:4-hydroxythreonine-4-phosphate dehydrogenase PdxA [candidate division KSB1 bacterium]
MVTKSTFKTLALTLGDINGIGPEVVLKALAQWKPAATARVALVAPVAAVQFWKKKLNIKPFFPIIQSFAEWPADKQIALIQADFADATIEIGNWTIASGSVAAQALLHATAWAKDGLIDAIVTGPTAKVALAAAGYNYPGQTEFIAERLGAKHFAMMLIAGSFRVALVTTHLPLRNVAAAITQERIIDKLRALHRELRSRFNIPAPKIAVTGLNPHAGESGMLGKEEQEIIEPALAQAQREGIAASGPFSADALFGRYANRAGDEKLSFDAFLTMYHDQGLIPLKMAGFGRAVNYTAGLPIVRTSPDHGTAFDIAGKGIANPTSMIEAIQLAVDIITKNDGDRPV